MGQGIFQALAQSPTLRGKGGFGRHTKDSASDPSAKQGLFMESCREVYLHHDMIVDVSSASCTELLLNEALNLEFPKPLLIGTTGIEHLFHTIALAAQKMPIVVAPNLSLGACLQRVLAQKLAHILPESYDIDILERHHKHKKDAPSGTTVALCHALKKERTDYAWGISSSPRSEKTIEVASFRSGNLPGMHEITFCSQDESLAITHTAFTRDVFVKGALMVLNALHAYRPGLYTMEDIMKSLFK